MGSGFPIRPTRQAFGPQLVNAGDETNPNTDVAATQFNLDFWQTAGLGIAGALAWARIDGTTPARLASGEAWNPNADDTLRPTVTRGTSPTTGHYLIRWATTYPDEDGIPRPLTLSSASVSAQVSGSTRNIVANWDLRLDAGTWLLEVWLEVGSTGAAIDAGLHVQVF